MASRNWHDFANLLVTKKLRIGKNGSITVVNSDGSESTINLTELAALDGIAAADLAKIDGITNGTVAAGKAAVVDTNKDIGDFRNLDAVNIDAGASGTAGTVDVFPSTASKGKLAISCTDQTGDTTVSVVAGAMAAARTLTIPDPGAAASFMMTEGAQTINGVQTYTVPRVADHNTGITAFATGGQASATALTGEWNNITICATAGDSVKLPAAVVGQVITVKNSGATTLAVFPATGDAINALAVNLSVDVAVSSEMTFRAIDGTTWETCEVVTLPAPSTQKGSLVIQAADSAGNTSTTITNASQAAARTYTIPDAGASASFVMTEGAQTINGVKTFGNEVDLSGNVMATEAGAGITGGTGTIYKSSVVKVGGIIRTSILLDLTGLSSSTTDLDIIGQGVSVAHLGQITAASNGTVLTGRMTCLEAPVGGVTDIDLYSATEGTGVFDGAIADLTETALLTSGAAWTIARVLAFTAVPAANGYLYLTGGAAGTAAAYTAGKFLIEIEGYDA